MTKKKPSAKAIVDTGALEAMPEFTPEQAIVELRQYAADNALTIDWKTAATLKNIFNRLG